MTSEECALYYRKELAKAESQLKDKDAQIKSLDEHLFKCQGFLLDADNKNRDKDARIASLESYKKEQDEFRAGHPGMCCGQCVDTLDRLQAEIKIKTEALEKVLNWGENEIYSEYSGTTMYEARLKELDFVREALAQGKI